MPYEQAHAPIYGYMKGWKHTIPLHLNHYARTFSIFKVLNTLKLGKVLNVGGADGYHSYLLKQLFNADVTTIDTNDHSLSVANKRYGLKIKHGSALDIPYPDDAFDTVLCIETIEHIEDSERVVFELLRVARHHLLISTESFFESEEQKQAFLCYIRETHPQFFRSNNPIKPGDAAYFTLLDFERLLCGRPFKIFAQFSNKHMEVLENISEIRRHVQAMTSNLTPTKKTKFILHCPLSNCEPNPSPLTEEALLESIVVDSPLFPIKIDEEMRKEDEENIWRVEHWHSEKDYAITVPAGSTPILAIDEHGAKGMSLSWLTKENLERSPMFCTRHVKIKPKGYTPERATPWEHQLHILTGQALLVEPGRTTPLSPGDTIHIEPNHIFQIRNETINRLMYLDIIPSISTLFGR